MGVSMPRLPSCWVMGRKTEQRPRLNLRAARDVVEMPSWEAVLIRQAGCAVWLCEAEQ